MVGQFGSDTAMNESEVSRAEMTNECKRIWEAKVLQRTGNNGDFMINRCVRLQLEGGTWIIVISSGHSARSYNWTQVGR